MQTYFYIGHYFQIKFHSPLFQQNAIVVTQRCSLVYYVFFFKKNHFKGNRSRMLFVGNPKCSHETISIRLLFQSYLRPAKLLKIYSITGVLNEFVGLFQKTNSEEHLQIYVFEKNVFQTSIFFLSNFEVLIAMQTCPLSANKI